MLDWMLTVDGWVSLATLTILEIVLGIDNLVFLTIAAQKLPARQQAAAQRFGLLGALALRVIMLAMLVWLTQLTRPIVAAFGLDFSWRDFILLVGGLFLLYKGTMEIHQDLDGGEEGPQRAYAGSLIGVIVMIMLIDAVFALDSVITAVGMTGELPVMIAANAVAIALMMMAAKPIGGFIARHPTVKMLALAFILLVGVALVADGFHQHIPREYIYFAIAFSMAVESLNLIARARRERGEEKDG
jgi:predicted tellurium resistance membrane protein TerC